MIAKRGDDLDDMTAAPERRGDFAWSAVRQFIERCARLAAGI